MSNLQEIWLSITNYEGLYEVSNYGNIRSLDKYVNTSARNISSRLIKGKILKPKNSHNGYCFIQLYRNGKHQKFLIHRLVASAFIPNPLNKDTVNHKDFNKKNNRLENLEWHTKKENNLHADSRQKRGERSSMSKLTESQVLAIREKKGKATTKEVAIMFGTCRSNIYSIWNNNTWTHLPK